MKRKRTVPDLSPRVVRRGHLFAIFQLSRNDSRRLVVAHTITSIATCYFAPPVEPASTVFEQVGAFLDLMDDQMLGCLEIRSDLAALISSVLSCQSYAVVEWINDRGVWCLDGIKDITV